MTHTSRNQYHRERAALVRNHVFWRLNTENIRFGLLTRVKHSTGFAMDKWTCSECTMRNAPHLDYCHECASPRRAGAHLGSGSARPSNQAAAGMNDSIASFGSRNDEGHSSSVRPFPGNMGRGLVGKKGNAPPSARAAVVESSMIVDDFGPEDSADDFDQDADGGDDDNDTTDADFDRGGLSLSQSSPGSGTKRKRRSKEQIEAEKSAKAAAKAAKAAAKSAKLAGVLAQKEAKANARAEGGSFQNQEIAVVMSDDLLLTQTGQVVANELMKEDYAIFSAAKPGEAEVLHGAMNSDYRVRVPPVPRGIFWVRRRIDPLRPVGKGKAHGYLPGITREPFAARVWVDDAFIAEVTSHGTDGLEATLDSERAQLPSGTRMLYLVQGAKAAATAWSQAAHREKQLHDAGKLARAPRKAVNNDMLDYAVLYLYVSSELEVKETVSGPGNDGFDPR